MLFFKAAVKQFLIKKHLYRLNFLRNKCYILPYHMVADEPNLFFPEISTSQFEKQIHHLVRNYHILSLEEIIERINNGKSLRRCVAITFDDGFKNNYERAYPILKKYNIPATIFLISGCIENGQPPWFIKFRYAFQSTRKMELKIDLRGETLAMPLITFQDRLECSNKIMSILKCSANEERTDLLDKIFHALKVNDFTELNGMMLSWDQIKEMSGNRISFGAHTVSHPILSQISLKDAEKEILMSKDVIEAHVGKKINIFAYPFGRQAQYSLGLIALLQRGGFICAVTTEHGENNHASSLYELKRSFPWELYG